LSQQIDWDQIERGVLEHLLPFQRRTAEWAFDRLYGADGQARSNRFLVADEVGLGKTLVAKAVVAKALKVLARTVKRIDVVYVCSNEEIAAQNLARLRIDGLPADAFQSQGRLTLLPLLRNSSGKQRALGATGINFLALTPTTSLNPRHDTGMALERALICRMVHSAGYTDLNGTRLRNLFANRASGDSFDGTLRDVDKRYTIDSDLLKRFHKRLGSSRNSQLRADLVQISDQFARKALLWNRSLATQHEARRVIGAIRAELAAVCIEALEPDLVIFDEFQRFPKLLDSSDDDSMLARSLFEQPNVRLLMLSATPYRLWADELEDPSGVGHYNEFLRTVKFLLRDDEEQLAALKDDLRSFNMLIRRVVQGGGAARETLAACRTRIEQRLTTVMSRTDRVPATKGRDAMVRSLRTPVAPDAADFVVYAGLQRVAAEVDEPDMLEYWRSAPYPLSFLSGYKVRERLQAALRAPSDALVSALGVDGLFMPTGREAAANIPNARARHMALELIDAGMHRIAWVPPSLPHYSLAGSFAGIKDSARTKRLLFSSWKMVPRAVSSVLDGAFVHAMQAEGVVPSKERHAVTHIDFPVGYPCNVFARDFDPVALAFDLEEEGIEPSAAAVQSLATKRLAPVLSNLMARFGDASLSGGDDWYWLGPLLLDMLDADVAAEGAQAFVTEALAPQGALLLAQAGMSAWSLEAQDLKRRIQLAVQVFQGQSQLPRMPADLPQVISWLAIAGPATCSLRSLGTAPGDQQGISRAAASTLALALLTYLSNEQMVGQLEWQYPQASSFWRRVLALCLDGCWSAVLDEYVSVLSQDRPESVDPDDPVLTWLAVPAGIATVLSVNPSVLRPERAEPVASGYELVSGSVTLRRARPLLERESKEKGGDGASSMTELRNAFNSPFMPFVLSSTSVGQEGLDFHWYCHAIVHWNVPSTPVDFEQRDGRIHRYRNHAVRRNVAHDWGRAARAVSHLGGVAQWKRMFEVASQNMVAASGDMDGMKPSWIYERGDVATGHRVPAWQALQQGGPAEIERHVPTMAHSKDCIRYAEMTQAVGCYRLVFAQPRQEDLLAHLMKVRSESSEAVLEEDLAINLRPPSGDARPC
jgi:hypothetical protein